MESLFSISGIAQVLGWIGAPVLAGAALLATLVLTGAAERLIDFVDGWSGRSPAAGAAERESHSW